MCSRVARSKSMGGTRTRTESSLSRDAHLEARVVRHGVMTLALVLAVAPMAPAQSRAPRASKTVAPAPTSAPPSTDSLEVISRRGKVLAERDSIAWLGADAMTSLSLPEDHVR